MTKKELKNEERQALIDYCNTRIAECATYAKARKVMEIALAALTAEPVAYYWFNESDYGRDVSLTSPEEDDDAAGALENGWQVEPLIRIPKLTGGDGC